jgi:broad specificity phosphatase PhoE
MSPLILVRHASPQIEPSQPSAEWNLSAEGQSAARGLSRRLSVYSPRAIFSGPEPKQIQTAEELGGVLSLTVTIHADFAEHRRRSTSFSGREQFEDAIRHLFAEPDRIVYGDESGDMAYARFSDGVARILDRQGEGAALVVSGGTAISLFVARRAGLEAFPFWKSLKTPTAIVMDRTTWAIDEILAP